MCALFWYRALFSKNVLLHGLYKSLAPVRLVTEFLQKSSAPNARESATECSILLKTENVYLEGMSFFV